MRISPGVLDVLLLVLGLGFVAGCGQQDGPTRYRVTGTITYNGQPVSSGHITFLPDASKGNDGPGGSAEIANGKFDTQTGQSPTGGPHRVTIDATDASGPGGLPKTLFPSYTTTCDLPKEDTTLDINVPKGGGSGI